MRRGGETGVVREVGDMASEDVGVPTDPAEVREAFRFLLGGVKAAELTEEHRVSREQMSELIQVVPSLRDGPLPTKKLVSSSGMPEARLMSIVTNNTVEKSFDPVAEAFANFSKDGETLHPNLFRKLFSQVTDVGKMSQEDLDMCLKMMDVDGDGVVSLEDFRAFTGPAREEENAAVAKEEAAKKAKAEESGVGEDGV